jgi:hypothetical protein
VFFYDPIKFADDILVWRLINLEVMTWLVKDKRCFLFDIMYSLGLQKLFYGMLLVYREIW